MKNSYNERQDSYEFKNEGLARSKRMGQLEDKLESDQKMIENYEPPEIRRHAVLMTMAPAGSKMGHGVFPFQTKRQVERKYEGEE